VVKGDRARQLKTARPDLNDLPYNRIYLARCTLLIVELARDI
jgi:hypothetical protein